ncbi:hypothetical protein [Marmoricola sp. URHB0036]|uniref:8-oxoguanine DNA glycosylase OGG fold protein n=1 Tax=Marmoricola sp. URHB0036 TaxID=1298863 RepID=UPI0012DDAA2E|nr:hypothetical protein [Marmoricola sp. URHB0036]
MTTRRTAPESLRESVLLWKEAGGSEQPPSRWSPTTWQRRFPEYAEYLSDLPMPISRADVAARCRDAADGPEQATRAFIAAMVWGHGPVGYGAFRTKRILDENAAAGSTLASVARIARDQGGPEAFAWLAQRQHRLHWLGVAFATKYLFFCAAGGSGRPALVLDRLVRDWLFNSLDWPLTLEWDVDDYRDYVETMGTWAVELDIAPGNLEMLVFQLAANADPRSLWSAPELFTAASSPSPPIPQGVPEGSAELLEMLDDAAGIFASYSSATDQDDVADFERGIRNLKRIILARR